MHAPDRGVVSLSSSTPNLPSALPPQNPPRKQDLDVAADEAIEICTSKEIPDNVMEVRPSPHILWPTPPIPSTHPPSPSPFSVKLPNLISHPNSLEN